MSENRWGEVFETNKGMPYEVDFFENQTCGATDLIYERLIEENDGS